MPIMFSSCVQKLLTSRQAFRVSYNVLTCNAPASRNFSDSKESGKISKPTAGTENEDRIRVRRVRPGDVPRLLRFVREHAATTWPGLNLPPSASHLVLCDYVARALAQGHSILAEHQENRRGGWSQIRGLALGVSICPWDAMMLEQWARCIQCSRSRRLLNLTAYCLRAPLLHDKYGVLSILQVILIVPGDTPNPVDVAKVLAKNAIQRGKDFGFPVVRFDVTDDLIAKTLENLRLTKEWQISYDSAVPEETKTKELTDIITNRTNEAVNKPLGTIRNIIVYTSLPQVSALDGKVTMNKTA